MRLNMNGKKIVTGGNIKWASILMLALSFFIYAQTQAKAKGKQEEKIETNSKVIEQLLEDKKETIEYRLKQTEQITALEGTTKNIKEDVTEIKSDNKEMIRILLEIKNKEND